MAPHISGQVGVVEDLREKFYRFGLRPDDKGTWHDLTKLLPAIAAAYQVNLGPAPSVTEIRKSFTKLRKGLHTAMAALRDLSEPGRNYLLGYEPSVASYHTRGPGGIGPEHNNLASDRFFDAAFGTQNRNYQAAVAAWRRAGNGRVDFKPYEEAFVALDDAEEKLRLALELTQLAIKGRERGADRAARLESLFEAEREAFRQVKDCEAAVARARLFLEPPIAGPAPYSILDDKLAELSALDELCKLAIDNFEKDWPKSSGSGQKGLLRPEMAGRRLVRSLIELIGFYWGEAGLDRISATPVGKENTDAGKFLDLLVAFHDYAVGGDVSKGRTFTEAMGGVSGLVHEMRSRLPKASPKVAAAPITKEKLEEARARLEAATANPKTALGATASKVRPARSPDGKPLRRPPRSAENASN